VSNGAEVDAWVKSRRMVYLRSIEITPIPAAVDVRLVRRPVEGVPCA
jgi:hypothetical protein